MATNNTSNIQNKKDYQKMTPAEITAKVEKLYKERQAEEMLNLLEKGIKVPAHTIEPFIKDAVIASFKSPKNLTFNSAKVLNNVNFESHLSSLFKIANFTPVYRHKFWGEFKDMQNDALNSNKKDVLMEKKRAFFETKKRKKQRKYLAEMEYQHLQNEKYLEEEKKKNEELAQNSTFTFWIKNVLSKKKEIAQLLNIIFAEKALKKELAELHFSQPLTDNLLVPTSSTAQAFQTLFLDQMKDFEEGKIKKLPQLDFLMAYAYLSSLKPGQTTRLTEEFISFPELKFDVTYGSSTTINSLTEAANLNNMDVNLFTALMKSQTLKLLDFHKLTNDNEVDSSIEISPELTPFSSSNKKDKDNELSLIELARENNMSSTHIAQIQAINSLIENISSNTNLNSNELKSLEDTKERLTNLITNIKTSPLLSRRGIRHSNNASNNFGKSQPLSKDKEITSELSNISKDLIQFQEEYYMTSLDSNSEKSNTLKRIRPGF